MSKSLTKFCKIFNIFAICKRIWKHYLNVYFLRVTRPCLMDPMSRESCTRSVRPVAQRQILILLFLFVTSIFLKSYFRHNNSLLELCVDIPFLRCDFRGCLCIWFMWHICCVPLLKTLDWLLVGCFENLRRFSDLSAILRLGSRR